MSVITVSETWRGHVASDIRENKRDVVLLARGADPGADVQLAINAVKAAMYDYVNPFYNDDMVGLIPLIGIDNLNDQGGGIWTGTAHYSTSNFAVFTPPVAGEQEIGFDIGTSTTHISRSLRTLNWAFAPGVFANIPGIGNEQSMTGLINKGAGADIERPIFQRTVVWYFASSAVTDDFINTLANMCCTVNNATFKGRAPGTVLFRGATGYVRRGSSTTAVSFRFAISPNLPALPTLSAAGITVTMPGEYKSQPIQIDQQTGALSDTSGCGGYAKNGWDLVWEYGMETVDETAKGMVEAATAEYVEQVYLYSDFSQLGIGT